MIVDTGNIDFSTRRETQERNSSNYSSGIKRKLTSNNFLCKGYRERVEVKSAEGFLYC